MKERQRRRTFLCPDSYYKIRANRWGETFLSRHRWQIGSMYDKDDIQQEAYLIYLRTFRRHPDKSEEDLFKMYKVALWGCLIDRSKQCFPNPYSKSQEGSVIQVQDEATAQSLFDGFVGCLQTEAETYFETLQKVPRELQGAFVLLLREVLGLDRITLRQRTKLRGKAEREPLNMALARRSGLDLSRDIMNELAEALGIQRS